MTITRVSRAMAILGGLVSLAFMVTTADYDGVLRTVFAADQNWVMAPEDRAVEIFAKVITLPGLLFFHVWVVLPFILSYVRAPRLTGFPAASSLFLAGLLLALGSSLYVYWKIFVIAANPDAQDGLVFLFLPLYQLLGLGVLDLTCGLIKRFT